MKKKQVNLKKLILRKGIISHLNTGAILGGGPTITPVSVCGQICPTMQVKCTAAAGCKNSDTPDGCSGADLTICVAC